MKQVLPYPISDGLRSAENLLILTAAVLVSSCAGTMKPMHTEPAAPGIVSEARHSLVQLPKPQEKIVAAVYRFRDQTGQYKPSDRVASWSTAVTQGATSILIKSMEDSGWFIPIEREGISNLLNERQIIQSIRQQHSGSDGAGPLPPLLFAGVMLEGGIIGYDTNVITAGAGLRYLGTGGSNMYRKDQVTIYLRAVSTQSGRVLKTVHTTKSVISQQLEGGAFRYIDTNRLLEAEAGYSYNEPPVMAVTEAIDEAVKLLIIEGIEDEIWSAVNPDEVASYKEKVDYEKRVEESLQQDYFGLLEEKSLRNGWTLGTEAMLSGYIGNYESSAKRAGVSFTAERSLNHYFSVRFRLLRTEIGVDQIFLNPLNGAELLLNVYATPDYRVSPYMSAGGSFLMFDKQYDFLERQWFPGAGFDIGLDYRLWDTVGFRLSSSYRYLFRDGLDGISEGKYNDQHWSVQAGVLLRPGFFNGNQSKIMEKNMN